MNKPNYITDRIVEWVEYLVVAIPFVVLGLLQFLITLTTEMVLVIGPYYFFVDKLSLGFATWFANIPGVSAQFAQVVLAVLPLIGITIHFARLHREDQLWKDLFGLRGWYKSLVGIEGHVVMRADDLESEEE